MMNEPTFQPDWASAPGDTIVDILNEKSLSANELARHLSRTREEVSDLLSGRIPVTPEIAERLSAVLGASQAFWINRESQYRQDLDRLQRDLDPEAGRQWLSEIPVKDMMKFGWIARSSKSLDQVTACLRFFGVPTIAAWRETYGDILQRISFRTSSSFPSLHGAVAAWIRHGVYEAAAMECKPWDGDAFASALSRIRQLTRLKEPHEFLPELRERCAHFGVAVVVLRAPRDCRASGAAYILPRKQRLILLSFRHLSDDHFWFSFFHEAAHLVLHPKESLFLEGLDSAHTAEEAEANTFAANVLIPPRFQAELRQLRLNGRRVMRFARDTGVSPGIVAGQLQHMGLIKHNQLNNLKRRYRW